MGRFKPGTYVIKVRRGRITEATLRGVQLGTRGEARAVLLDWIERERRTRWTAEYRAVLYSGSRRVDEIHAAGE